MARLKYTDSKGQNQVVEVTALAGFQDSEGNDVGKVVIDGFTATQSRLTQDIYNLTTVYSVVVITKGTGILTMIPLSGDAPIVITAAELTAMGASVSLRDFPGPFSSVDAGTAMSVLLYRD